MRRIARKNTAALEAEVAEWNKLYPVGTPVEVTRDMGEILTTKTRSHAWVLSGHTSVVMVDGISGCYLLERVRPIETATTR